MTCSGCCGISRAVRKRRGGYLATRKGRKECSMAALFYSKETVLSYVLCPCPLAYRLRSNMWLASVATAEILGCVQAGMPRAARSRLGILHGQLPNQEGLQGGTGWPDLAGTVLRMWRVYSCFATCSQTDARTDTSACTCSPAHTYTNTSLFCVWRRCPCEGMCYEVSCFLIATKRRGLPSA